MHWNSNIKKIYTKIIVSEYQFLQLIEFIDIILNSLHVKLICYVSDMFLIYVCVRFTATSEEYPSSNTMKQLNPKI